MLKVLFVLTVLAVAALAQSCEQIILAAGRSSLMTLSFDACSSPPTLQIKTRNENAIMAQASPWVTRHTTNPDIIIVASDDHENGTITSWMLDSSRSKLTFADLIEAQGSCAHITVTPDGGYVATANLYGATAGLIPINPETGKFSNFTIPSFLNFTDYQLKPGQINSTQLLRHPHHWLFHPYLPVAYLTDLGADEVRRFAVDFPGQLRTLTPIDEAIASGPRHSVLHPSGKVLYTVHEISSTVSAATIDVNTAYGDTKVVQSDLPLLPENANTTVGAFQGSELQISYDGRYLYATTRNNSVPQSDDDPSDNIALFSISDDGTKLTRQELIPSGSRYLRHIALSPAPYSQEYTAQYVITGGEWTNDTTVFFRNQTTGMLTKLVHLQTDDQAFSSFLWL